MQDRVDPNEFWWFVGHNLVWMAAAHGHFWVLWVLIAYCGNQIHRDILVPQPTSTPAQVARLSGFVRCAKLLEKFERCPQDVQHQVQWRFGFPEARAARLLAQVVLLCDGFLHLKTLALQASQKSVKCWRFFAICQQLPLELQMVLCNRVFGSTDDLVLTQDLEPALRRHVFHIQKKLYKAMVE